MARTLNISDRTAIFDAIKTKTGSLTTITRQELVDVCEANDLTFPQWITGNMDFRAGRGLYDIAAAYAQFQNEASGVAAKPVKTVKAKVDKPAKSVKKPIANIQTAMPVVNDAELMTAEMKLALVHNEDKPSGFSLVPDKASGYVPFGHFNDVRSIIKSGKFYPLYITGLSGNGKTMMVEQVCATEKRECIRTNITIETDEDDLLGGFRLVDGKTVWQNGPVIHAMERGAVLLLDEVDLGSNKLMCLQPVLEGKPIFLKKINKLIMPAPGFNIVATANTKGKGSDDGRFIGTNVMNEAFLERFSITLEQEYPTAKVESKILTNVLAASGVDDKDFVNKLVQWSEVIRKSFFEGAVSDIISTRRLVHICEAFAIFNQDREKAITLCLNRFDVDTKNSFLDLYKKLDETIVPPAAAAPTVPTEERVEVLWDALKNTYVHTGTGIVVTSNPAEVVWDAAAGKYFATVKAANTGEVPF